MVIPDCYLTEPVTEEIELSFQDIADIIVSPEAVLSELDTLIQFNSKIDLEEALLRIASTFGIIDDQQRLFDKSTKKKAQPKKEEKEIVQESDLDALLADHADKVESKLMYSTVVEFPLKDLYTCGSCSAKKIEKGVTHCPVCGAKLLWM